MIKSIKKMTDDSIGFRCRFWHRGGRCVVAWTLSLPHVDLPAVAEIT